MSACERCWWDASLISRETGEDRIDCYRRLLKEREGPNICTPEEQAGQFWDEKNQRDRRAFITRTPKHSWQKNSQPSWQVKPGGKKKTKGVHT